MRSDKKLVDQAMAVFAELGLTQTTAVTAFFEKVVAEGGMPFDRELSPVQRATQSFWKETASAPVHEFKNAQEVQQWLGEDD